MAVRRGVWVVIVLIVLAVSISAIGMLLLLSAVGREPQVSSNSTLVLRVGGDLNEMDAGGVLGPFIEGPPTVRAVVEMLRKAKTDKRVTSIILKPSGSGALWGKVQEVRDAVSDFRRSGKPVDRLPRIRRRAGVLPGDGVRQGVPDADRHARPDGHGQLRAVPARHARQDRRVSRRAAHRPVQDGVEHADRAHLYRRAPGDGGVAEQRPVRADGARHRRRPEEERSRRQDADRSRAVPARGRAARRPDRRSRLRGRARRQGEARDREDPLPGHERVPPGQRRRASA